MTDARGGVVVIGYGNPGRGDDGLGPALAEAVERLGLPGVTVDSDYQLTVEDAELVARHAVVVFADAATEGPEPFFVRTVTPGESMSFSTHSVRPEGVMGLAEQLFGAETRAFVLGIRGYEFNEFGERLSDRARQNLVQAETYLRDLLRRPGLEDIITALTECATACEAPRKGEETR